MPPLQHEPWYYRFRDLMPFHMREVLLVASSYDTLILEEHGDLNERLFEIHRELELSTTVRITMARSGGQAMDLLRERPFDLVIAMVRLEDMDANEFGRLVKAHDARMGVVLLGFSEAGLGQLQPGVDSTAIDSTFLWTGDIRLLLAIIKVAEDRLNVAHDTEKADVRVVLVVEDDVRHYSTILSLLYSELLHRSHSLIMFGLDALPRRMVMRARPKILLAHTFEEASHHFDRFHEYLLAVVSDVRFPKDGVQHPAAGIQLARLFHQERPEVPIMLLSLEPRGDEVADDLGIFWVDKRSASVLLAVREFIGRSLGFGEFVFRLSDGTEVARAHDLEEMQRVLRTVPAASIAYHSSLNHFSAWLQARSLLHLAQLLRPRHLEQFEDVEGLRQHLLTVFQQARMHDQTGVIHDFTRGRGQKARLVRLGTGSIGGKARGLAFAHAVLLRHDLHTAFDELPIRIPRTVAIGTDEFDRFVRGNPAFADAWGIDDDRELVQRALRGHLSEDLSTSLAALVDEMPGPLAVRSSSLLEDSHAHPFAGIYATFMLPNQHPDHAVRVAQLVSAVKTVYASTWSRTARSFIRSTPYQTAEEKMGVIIQEIVGRRHGTRFYPTISGVGRSFNHYPVRYMKSEDGVALVALGLGHSVVLGRAALQFCPRAPGLLPQFRAPRDFALHGQSEFYAVDLGRNLTDFLSGPESSLALLALDAAEQDGTLATVGSVYSEQEDQVRDDLSLPGTRVVTFNNILRWKAYPLAAALDALLEALQSRMGCPVEIEFAADLPALGQPGAELYVLQVRPQLAHLPNVPLRLEEFEPGEVLCHTPSALGHGFIGSIRDVLYVKAEGLDWNTTPDAAREVGQVNARLLQERATCLLLGPGRWGTSDPRLGVPVEWSDITAARVIVEFAFHGRPVEPSQGAHFFHNIITARIGYLTVLPPDQTDGDTLLDLEWLNRQPAVRETERIRHIRLDSPLRIYLDGIAGRATVLKPKS